MYQQQAIEKISAELKTFKGGNNEKVISQSVADALKTFCEQDDEFAQAIVQSDKTLSDCCAEISLLENQIAELKEETAETEYDAEADELRDKVKNLTEELCQKENAYKNDIEKVKKETAEAVRAEIQQDGQDSISEKVDAEVKKQLDKAVKNAKKEAVKEAEARLKAQAEKQESKIKDLEAALTSAGTEKEKLEKKLALSDSNSAKAMVYIEAIQDNFNSLFSLIGEMENEQGNRFRGAVLKLVGVMKQKAEE